MVTDNVDLLHQQTGMDVLRVHELNPFFSSKRSTRNIAIDPSSIDAILCIGMGGDRRGLVRWYQSQNPNGSVIHLNTCIPVQFQHNPQDRVLLGDAQLLLPQISQKLNDALEQRNAVATTQMNMAAC